MASTPKKSKIWAYFEEDEKLKIARCNLCKKQYAYKTATSSMIRHLESKHKITVVEEKKNLIPSKTQSSIQQFIPQDVRPYPRDSSRHIECTKSIAEYIIKDMRPFDTVSSSSFRNMLQTLDPR